MILGNIQGKDNWKQAKLTQDDKTRGVFLDSEKRASHYTPLRIPKEMDILLVFFLWN